MITKGAAMDIWSLQRQGYSFREIGRQLKLDRRTVKKYVENGELPRHRGSPRESGLAPYQGMIRDWLGGEEYTAARLWHMVQEQGYTGSYETVKRYARQVKGERARVAYLRFETEPGRQAQVDFGEMAVTGADGQAKKLFLFVMVLGYSRALYAELVERCTLAVFLECHQRAFGYLGGIPGEILYDNMKNVVIRRLAGRVEWNAKLLEFAAHYRFQPVACPPYAPWVKGKVERPLHYIREAFWRGARFGDLAGANRALREWLTATANRRLHGTVKEVVAARWEQERPKLGELPQRPFDTAEGYWRKVGKDCLVQFCGNAYMAPHRAVGRIVLVKVRGQLLRIFLDEELLAVYPLPEGRGHILCQESFRQALRLDPEQFRRKFRGRQGKGKATLGLVNEPPAPATLRRDLREYDRLLGVAL